MNDIIKNKYLIQNTLKEGKFGNTYLVNDIESDKKYIIKYLSLKKSDLINKIPLLEQEAKIISHLSHPKIPKFIDFFTEIDEQNVKTYFVQEYIQAQNLNQRVKEKGVLSEKQIIKIVIGICDVLKYIHSFSPSVIHQDIKPANILYTDDEKVYLIDFGSVKQKIFSHENSGLSTIIGTHGYMAIEQFEGRTVIGSDIYSLGLTIIFLLTGKDPLLLEKVGLKFNLKNLNISDKFKNVLEKMIQPDSQKRYKSSKELEEDLISTNLFNKTKIKQNNRFYNMVKSELAENEQLRWYGKPHFKLSSMIKSSFSSSEAIFIVIAIIIFNLPGLFNKAFFFALLVAIRTFYYYFSYLKETYIITDHRIITIEQKAKIKIVKTYNNSDIRSLNILNISNKRGDINIIRKNHLESFKLKSLDNVELVNKIINEVIIEEN